ncbi:MULTISPECIES: class I adenylate-forming enzyme family protein [unclassified Thermoactinomyces]|jgi:long-chain acyl-CoA synthetase|uniref:class I adenylate-forming enzyme family protein n=1 Tax=unclassified Thermoactinomyces TaxID=2634588 RepID=UPI0018DE22C0|nr:MULTISPECIES: long-chain-fatty-acid--CoA ligase [unclassified Thermoactinomyces]MBH8599223.1 long-chain-fatty-acid--CoA ligase [Thermoactinomyces sp. CICC 10523]MBH8605575.1 long-chain-fatty-acid--CoA ligase [Thermoactinomyces sp. CICC 10522]MBH8609008.1 long-chain-fatty-acid--CoA ligase [Thermoactinomyces sp. CICC 10521]
MRTITDIMNYRVHFTPGLEALVDRGKRYTYQEYNHRVNQMAHYLLELKVKKGDRIAILCKNNYLFPVIVLATMKLGAIAVPLNWRLNPNELEYILRDSKPAVVFYDKEFSFLLSEAKKPDLQFTEIRAESGIDGLLSLETLLHNRPVDEPDVVLHEDDPATIIYTSGTTGNPKGVVTSHKSWIFSVIATANALEWRFRDRYLAAAPLFHVSGIIITLGAIYQGMTIVFMEDFDPSKIWELIEAERIATMFAVPTMFIYMLPELMRSQKEITSLRNFIVGGSPVPRKLIEQYDLYGYEITQVYGCTECTGLFSVWHPHMGMEKCISSGKTILGGELKIINPETGQEVPTGEVGEILIRGPQLFMGYWNNPEATRKALRDGWFCTGDAGKVDEDGFLYVLDRYKDMIICGGTNIYPAQVEGVIKELDDVLEVALIGIPHAVWGEIPRAYIVKKPGSNLTEADVLYHCHQKLANYKVSEVVFIDSLPKNNVGKVLKRVLREQAIKQG